MVFVCVDGTGSFHYKWRQILLPEVVYRHMFLMKGLSESNEFSEVTWRLLLFSLKLGTPCSIINKSSYHTHTHTYNRSRGILDEKLQFTL